LTDLHNLSSNNLLIAIFNRSGENKWELESMNMFELSNSQWLITPQNTDDKGLLYFNVCFLIVLYYGSDIYTFSNSKFLVFTATFLW